MSPPSETFRFLDLPSEIRIAIYRLLLCSFGHRLSPDPLLRSARREKSTIQANILCVNKQIYREAFDVMFKVNRFIQTSMPADHVLDDLLILYDLPVVAQTEGGLRPPQVGPDRFRGYILSLHLEKVSSQPQPLETFMILPSELDHYCQGLRVVNPAVFILDKLYSRVSVRAHTRSGSATNKDVD
ncbi:hypothetical protein M011DRAFT_257852 [Sporormia fimetaria CBS 119925]|uniref:F-box domain-containing protein n=1 Tax=Sporormia fimetaria CBS 119925 TaxID=1340428 RepID=A0A6A6UYG6_9PLEO|nr:hypothetical protein M011DRAFT_257852 [Sporormia fimetaria CBS 119925]